MYEGQIINFVMLSMAFFYLKNNAQGVEANTAFDALDKLRTLIKFGPESVDDWIKKSKKTHPQLDTKSHEAFLESLIEHGYVQVTEENWAA